MKFVKVIIIACVFNILGCSSFSKPENHTLLFKQDVSLKSPTGKVIEAKKDQEVQLDNESYFIESPDHISMLVLPFSATETKKTEIQLKPRQRFADEALTEQLANNKAEEITARLLPEVISIQAKLAQRQFNDALLKSQLLQKEYPYISYLKIIEASCYAVMGKRQQAIVLLEQVSSEFPSDQNARTLLNSLKNQRGPANQ